MRQATLTLLAGLLGAGALGGQALSARAEPLQIGYDITLAGLPVMDADITVERGDGSYRAHLRTDLSGLIGQIKKFTLISDTRGDVVQGALAPVHYTTENEDRKRREASVTYEGDGQGAKVEADPPPEDDNREPVPEAQVAAAVDPLTAFLAGLAIVDRDGACHGSMTVFDGRRLFGLTLHNADAVTVPSGFGLGPQARAMACRVEVAHLAGFKSSELRKKTFPDEIRVTLASNTGQAPWIPVSLSLETGLGRFAATLSSLSGLVAERR